MRCKTILILIVCLAFLTFCLAACSFFGKSGSGYTEQAQPAQDIDSETANSAEEEPGIAADSALDTELPEIETLPASSEMEEQNYGNSNSSQVTTGEPDAQADSPTSNVQTSEPGSEGGQEDIYIDENGDILLPEVP